MKRWQALILTPLPALPLGVLILTWPVGAQDRPCAADVQKFCTDLASDNRSGMMQCLKDHDTNLSDACKARMQTFAHEPWRRKIAVISTGCVWWRGARNT